MTFQAKTAQTRLCDVRDGVVRPFSQTESRAVTGILKEAGQREPVIAAMLAENTPLKTFVIAALALSPYLKETTAADPRPLAMALSMPLEALLSEAIEDARQSWKPAEPGAAPAEAEVMARLRTAKRRVAYVLALADLARLHTARETTRWLSLLADACVAAAVDHLLLTGHEAGK